jgi:glycosyltransferase involved in cell wall biosynthesis
VGNAVATLRQALAARGIDLEWAAADDEAGARALLRRIEGERPVFVLAHVLTGQAETNLLRYLPREVPRILMVHAPSLATYRAARAVRDWVDAAVVVSPRIRRDLIRFYGFREEAVEVIANPVALNTQPRTDETGGGLRVLSLGRIDRIAKGLDWLPDIVRRAVDAGVDVSLTIGGVGPDLARLRERIAACGLAGRTTFLGSVEHERVPGLMCAHDVFLFPSVFEGLGLALIEAMAGGCVPVASRIRGVTDWVVAEGETGLLFPVGDTRAAAWRLVELDRNRRRLRAMSEAARRAARARFKIEDQAAAFVSLIQRVIEAPRRVNEPLLIERWRVPAGLRPAWWHALPEPLKALLRVTRERMQFRQV